MFEEHDLYRAAFALTIWIDQLFDQKCFAPERTGSSQTGYARSARSAKLAAALSGDSLDEME